MLILRIQYIQGFYGNSTNSINNRNKSNENNHSWSYMVLTIDRAIPLVINKHSIFIQTFLNKEINYLSST